VDGGGRVGRQREAFIRRRVGGNPIGPKKGRQAAASSALPTAATQKRPCRPAPCETAPRAFHAVQARGALMAREAVQPSKHTPMQLAGLAKGRAA
jgi:hypothetical protein